MAFAGALACGPSVGDAPESGGGSGEGEGSAGLERSPQEIAVYTRDPADGPALACIPVDEGCLRLFVDVAQDRVDALRFGVLVGANCHDVADPDAIVEGFHAHVSTAHGSLLINGELTLDEGTTIPLAVSAPPADTIEGLDCD